MIGVPDDEIECPYCGQYASRRSTQHYDAVIKAAGKYDRMIQRVTYFYCPNPRCRESTVTYVFGVPKYGEHAHSSTSHRLQPSAHEYEMASILSEQTVKPLSRVVQSPENVPIPLLNDYLEACRIETLSPKAAATLARRLVQSIIRDFYKVQGRTLKHEIDQIKSRVGDDVYQAIDALRRIGNIGAHPSEYADRIVDVEPAEARALLAMVGILFRETYVEQGRRNAELSRVTEIAESKEKVE